MKTFKYVFFALLLSAAYDAGRAGAQAPISLVSYSVVPSAALATGCPLPTAGSTIYCQAGDKFQVSANGAPYVVIWPAPTAVAGVTSITVGAGTKQTGDVILPAIPSHAIIPAVTGTLQ